MAGDGAVGVVDSVGPFDFGPPVNAVGGEGGQAGPLADEFQNEILLARGDGTSVAPSVVADTTEQVGYGATPGGVRVTELHRLSPEDVSARIDAHLDAYDPDRNPAALREALDLAVAYRAQGGTVDFGRIRDNPRLDGRARAEVTVAERRANMLAAASGNIQALNREGINYGSELYETLRLIENAQPGPLLGLDPQDAAAYNLIVDQRLRARQSGSFVSSVENLAFRKVMAAAGYDNLFGEAARAIAAMDERAIADRQAALARMAPSDRLRYVAGQALDAGALSTVAAIGIGIYGMTGLSSSAQFQTAPINWQHIFHGEVRTSASGASRGIGGHYIRSPDIRIVETLGVDRNGVTRARIEIRDPATGRWVPKGPASTFFPSDWSQRRVRLEVEGAFRNSSPMGNTGLWEGISPSGLRIQGYYTRPNGGAATAFPVYGN